MEPLGLLFLSSGLFLGWALGANDAANVFGTAVGTKMVRWRTAAIICSVFIILGAVISGAGTSHTLGKLGAISALPAAFMTALSAAVAVYAMTKSGLPVSTSQAMSVPLSAGICFPVMKQILARSLKFSAPGLFARCCRVSLPLPCSRY